MSTRFATKCLAFLITNSFGKRNFGGFSGPTILALAAFFGYEHLFFIGSFVVSLTCTAASICSFSFNFYKRGVVKYSFNKKIAG